MLSYLPISHFPASHSGRFRHAEKPFFLRGLSLWGGVEQLQTTTMATLKLHYEGWLALPTGLRQKLGLKSGDQLEAELISGTIVLRRIGRSTSPQVLPEEPEAEPERAVAPI